MTKEVHIYIGLFIILLGYLFYMDNKNKTAPPLIKYATVEEHVLSTKIDSPLPYVPSFTTKERDALENPEEGMMIYLKDAERTPHFQVFYRSKPRKGLGLPPVWTYIDDPTLQAEEDERRKVQEISLGDLEETTK